MHHGPHGAGVIFLGLNGQYGVEIPHAGRGVAFFFGAVEQVSEHAQDDGALAGRLEVFVSQGKARQFPGFLAGYEFTATEYVDEDFLDESDQNNNGIRDEEENDKDPNYEFDVGLRGMHVLMKRKTSHQNSSIDLDVGLQFEENLREKKTGSIPSAAKAYTNLVYKKKLANDASMVVENELKLVKDRIPDETWYFAGFLNETEERLYRKQAKVKWLEDRGDVLFFNTENGVEVEKRRRDTLLMQNDLINTSKITWEYSGIEHMVTTGRVKLQYDFDFERDNEHYEVGIFKTLYRMRPSKPLEISPMFKYTVRNGFRMAEDHYDDFTLMAKNDGEQVSRRIQLRQIEQADVRDMASAVILKVVYQFTKTIKITGGGQILFYNDMLENENDFLRQALLAEMEKSFVAYRKPLFLHIGARYIDQQATGDANDRNFMETFVRVFGKF